MALSWNEIKERAIAFSKEWEDSVNEKSDANAFLIAFFEVFGVSRKRVATFEHKVKKLDGRDGFIDMLWKGTLLVEMKSRGRDLDKAFGQAKDYFPGLKEHELPKYILVCDLRTFRLYDLETDRTYEFEIKELYKKVSLFGFISGHGNTVVYKEQDPVNIKAAESMGKLHDQLKAIGYEGHSLELYLVRLLFCMFADDTTIFNKNTFYDYILTRTAEDGSDLAPTISQIFDILNTPPDKRLKNLSEELSAFPYVNGKLFEERLPLAGFDGKMRDILLNCCTLDWGKISPAIFGSMFQSVMNPVERRNLGAHYTSENNILKLIKPLFLDALWAEFEKIRHNDKELAKFHAKISTLRFLDPACGCGNFLVITYRELRLLELEVLKALKKGQRVINIEQATLCDVDKFYGIEYEEFPAQIAQVAMWLMDHQMNMLFGQEFGEYFVRLPLRKSATILHADALTTPWESIVPQDQLSYILGNPPFIGSKIMTQFQRDQVVTEFDGAKGVGVLDYVTAWYGKSAKFIQGTNIKVAFVSTNSIVQGEQVGVLWGLLLNKYGLKIHFAHRTFKWSNEARGKAAVYCVIIGYATFDTPEKKIFEYEHVRGEANEVKAQNINPYLVNSKDILLLSRSKSLCMVPQMEFGSMPNDGGFLLLDNDEKEELEKQEPLVSKFIKPLISAKEFLSSEKRWCIWLVAASPSEIRQMPIVADRIAKIKELRSSSQRDATRKLAMYPSLFGEIRQPSENYILIPAHSSESRKYIPMGFMTKDDILNNSCLSVPQAGIFHFGILMSMMHMTWIKYVCGRIKSDFRYSINIVYNNFPWPENPTEKQIRTIEDKAQKVLDARAIFPNSSLADLYDPLSMPPALVKAHNELDRAVDPPTVHLHLLQILMKKILGLDLGTNSIGWALVGEDDTEKRIIGIGSRIIPMGQDVLGKFDSGQSISQTAERTGYRGIRRLRERHLLRRERLHRILSLMGFLPQHYELSIDRYGKFIDSGEPKLAWKQIAPKEYEFLFQSSFNEMTVEFKALHPELFTPKANGIERKIPYDHTIYYLRKKALTHKIEDITNFGARKRRTTNLINQSNFMPFGLLMLRKTSPKKAKPTFATMLYLKTVGYTAVRVKFLCLTGKIKSENLLLRPI